MAVKKSDYFGKFLDTLPDPKAATPVTPAAGPLSRTSAEVSQTPTPSLIEPILKALEPGPKSLGELISATGGTLTMVLDATKELGAIGYVERIDADVFRLTERGLDALKRMTSAARTS